MSHTPTILLTRPQGLSEQTAKDLTALGYAPVISPILVIKPVPAIIPVTPTQYDGLVFTSIFAVHYAGAKWGQDKMALSMPVYCVGDKTAQALTTYGFDVCVCEKDGKTLSQNLAENLDGQGQNLLYVSGRDISVDLSKTLAHTDISVERHVVYKAEKEKTLTENLLLHLKTGTLDGALFFSARTAENFVQILKDEDLLDKMQNVMILCLGAGGAKIFRESGFENVFYPARPDWEHLKKLMIEKMDLERCKN